MKKIIIILLTVLLCTSQVITAFAQNDSDTQQIEGYLLATENSKLALYYVYDRAAIAVRDKSNNKIWYSSLPESEYPSEGTTDIIKSEMQSLLNISYTLINKVTSSEITMPLEEMKYTTKAKVVDSGVEYEIVIKDINLIFNVVITLDDNSIEVSIPDDKIQEEYKVDEQLTKKTDNILKFIDDTLEKTRTLKEDQRIPSNTRDNLKKGIKQLEELRSKVEKLDTVVGIETVCDKYLTAIKDIENTLIGSSTKQGFFSKIATSDTLSKDIKSEYFKKQSEFEDAFMPVKLTVSSLKLIDAGCLVEIEVMPYFGGCGDKTSGYMLYPNGSGAINVFKEKHGQYTSNFRSAVYSDQTPDIDWEKSIDNAGLKRTTIPYFGVKQGDNSFLGYITSGKGESNIIFSPSGYVINVNRISSSFTYRRTVAISSTGGQWQAGQKPTAYEEERSKFTASLKYIFQNSENANYSGMANDLRKYMLDNEILVKSQTVSDQPALALDFLGGYSQTVMLMKNYIEASTFSDIQKSIEAIVGNNEIPIMINIRGYRVNGYGEYPAKDKVASQIGGMDGLINLSDYMKSKKGKMFLEDNFIEAQVGQKGYNEGDLALSTDYRVINSADKLTYLLSPMKFTQMFQDKELGFLKKTQAQGATFDLFGTFVYYDYSGKHKSTREQTIDAYKNVMDAAKREIGAVAVYGGNEYTLSYADWIKDVPMGTSGYLHTDYEVPFYQMLIHGYIQYTAEPVDQQYDEDLGFLKSIEYGTVPFYRLTVNPINTSDVDAYVSQFGVVYEDIIDTYNKYTKDLAGLSDKEMIKHTKDNGVAVIEYSDGNKVLINYNDTAKVVDGVTVSPKSYAVTKPKGGITLEKEKTAIIEQGKQSGLYLYNSMDYWILAILLISVGLLACVGFFNHHKSRNI